MPKVVLLDVVADDTDVAILLLYHWHEALHDIYFTSEKSRRIWSIEQVANYLQILKTSYYSYAHLVVVTRHLLYLGKANHQF